MPSREQIENMLAIATIVTRERPGLAPLLIARNVGKLQKIAITLQRERAPNDKAKRLAQRALELARELGGELREAPENCALLFILNNVVLGKLG